MNAPSTLERPDLTFATREQLTAAVRAAWDLADEWDRAAGLVDTQEGRVEARALRGAIAAPLPKVSASDF